MELNNLISPGIWTFALAGILYLLRNTIKASIIKGVQHNFDKKIETLKSELRENEAEISSLRNGVLSGRENRQALLDRRRMEAAENVWTAVVELGKIKFLSQQMSILHFDKAAEEAARNPNASLMFKSIGGAVKLDELGPGASKERLFITPLAWSFYEAYSAILYYAVVQQKLLEGGVPDASKLLNTERVSKLIKEALPYMDGYVDEHGSAGFHYLLEPLEKNILNELQNMLGGIDTDRESISRSAKILEAVNDIKIVTAKAESDLQKAVQDSKL